MLPLSSTEITNGIEIIKQTSFTYKLDIEKEKIKDYIDNIEAVKQFIYKTLMTDRYRHEIYNWNYGVEIDDLFGKSKNYVKTELPQRIEDALKVDDRIEQIYDFVFSDINKNTILVKFCVSTIFGEALIDWQVSI